MKNNSTKYNFIRKVGIAILISLTLSVNIFSQDLTESNQMPEIKGKIVTQISFVNRSGVIVVPVRINDSRILNMILDSGMSSGVVILFHKELGDELKLVYSQKAFVAGAGSEQQKPVSICINAKVNLEDIEMRNQTVVVFDDSKETSEWSWDGVIGKSLFDKYVTEIDYEKSTITFYEPDEFNITNSSPIPINIDYGFPVVDSEVKIESDEKFPLKLVVDIGHRSALFIKEDSTKSIMPPGTTIKGIAGRGIQGEVTSKIGLVQEVKIGNISLTNIPTSFLSKDANMGIPISIARGDIGTLLLYRFKLILDYSRKQMYLIPNKNFDKSSEINMAGLMIEQDIDGKALVRYVTERSPAEEIGIQKGDKIISLNGKNIKEYTFYEVNDLFTQEGVEVEVIIKRYEEEKRMVVKLKKLI